MWIRLGTIACLVFLALLPLYVATILLLKSRRGRQEAVAYIRGYKKGNCAVVYFPALLLYWMGLCEGGWKVGAAFFKAIPQTLSLVVLSYNTEDIADLMARDNLYRFTVYFCFVLVLLNALMFALSVFLQNVWNALQRLKARFSRRDSLVLVGNNPENVAIYHSDTSRSKLILEYASGKDRKQLAQEKEALYVAAVASRCEYAPEYALCKLVDRAAGGRRNHLIVLNTRNDKQNITLCKCLVDHIKALPAAQREQVFRRLKIYVFGDNRYETLYADMVQNSLGCVHYVNKYQKVAMDFVDKYPFTQFMDEKHIDYQTSLIYQNVNINALLIGFGKTNQQIFMTSIANNQFLTGTPANPVAKPVYYHIFDKESAENNKNLNHSYFRYKNECCDEKGNFVLPRGDYLPPPALPAQEQYHHLNIHHPDFYRDIHAIVRNPQDVNFVVIAYGTDLENLDMAQKLVEKRKEWGLRNLHIFVKVQDWRKEYTFLEDAGCVFFGNRREVIFDIEKITGDKIYAMSQMRDVVYSAEAKKQQHRDISEADFLADAVRQWHAKKNQLERESSLYGCLSLRSKLHLMGLDYCEADCGQDPGLSEQEYWHHYAGEDMPQVSGSKNGRSEISYTLDFKQSRRKTMAIQEHQRWNAFVISKGMIPATRQQILQEQKDGRYTNGKDYALRRHGNLTTFAGLEEFRQIVAARDHVAESEADVIKYDYQLLDHAHWLLTRQGYKIIRR